MMFYDVTFDIQNHKVNTLPAKFIQPANIFFIWNIKSGSCYIDGTVVSTQRS